MPEQDPSTTVSELLASGRNIRFGRGVVAKTSYIAASALVVWGIIAFRWSTDLIANTGLAMIGLVATAFAAWFIKGTQTFAERNPAQAMLEGAELLEWQRMAAQAKGTPPVLNPPLVDTFSTPDLVEGPDAQ